MALTESEIRFAGTIGVELLKVFGKVRAAAAAQGVELEKLIAAAEHENASTIFDAVNAIAPGMIPESPSRQAVSDMYYTPLATLPPQESLERGTRIFQFVSGGASKFWLVRPNDTTMSLPSGAELFSTVA